jgi:hypothetical protein
MEEMSMKKIALLLLMLISGCTSMSSLTKPTQEQYFVLEKNYTKVATRGLLNYKWVEGLRAGTYTLVGEDHDGMYFLGEGDCVIVLSQERAEKYLQTAEITPFELRNKPQFTIAGGIGGLWLPKPGVNKEPKLFYEIRNTTDGSVGGMTGMAIVKMTEGSFGYVPFSDEKEFLSNIRLIKK